MRISARPIFATPPRNRNTPIQDQPHDIFMKELPPTPTTALRKLSHVTPTSSETRAFRDATPLAVL